jgi:uncharacterized protein (TIGR00251 family)
MKNLFFEKTLDGALKLYLKVQPNSSFLKFGSQLETGEFKVYLTKAPEHGKANEQLIQFLAKSFKVAKSSVILEKGEASQHKTLIILEKLEKQEEIITFLHKI